MKSISTSEKLLIEEIRQASMNMKATIRGLSIGMLIKLIRKQLGISQQVLAKRAGVPQSTVSRIEIGNGDTSLSILNKILNAMSSDLVVVPMLRQPTEIIRQNQARKIAERHIRYLKGTMNLEDQQPDSLFIEELLKEEEQRLLQGTNKELWKE